jgi:hypothetical protein
MEDLEAHYIHIYIYIYGIYVSCFDYDVDDLATRLAKVLGLIITSISSGGI